MNLKTAVSRADRRDAFARAIAPAWVTQDVGITQAQAIAADVYRIAEALGNESARLFAVDVEERTDPPGALDRNPARPTAAELSEARTGRLLELVGEALHHLRSFERTNPAAMDNRLTAAVGALEEASNVLRGHG